MALHKWDIWAKSVLFKLKENKPSERDYKWTINYLTNQDATTNFIKDTKIERLRKKLIKWDRRDWHNYSWRNSWNDCSEI